VRLALALLVAFGALCGCHRGDSHGRGGSAARTQTEAQTVRAEAADVDAAIKRVPRARALVQSYHIESERLSVSVDGVAWKRLGTAGQDAFKRAMWKAWSESYLRHRGRTGERIFFSVYDEGGNDLGSYFGL
jgi:hypothetical protein